MVARKTPARSLIKKTTDTPAPSPAPTPRRSVETEAAAETSASADPRGTSAAADPQVGIDPRATETKNELDAKAGRVVAAPPTPTQETSDVANDPLAHPAEQPVAVRRRPAKVELISVTVPRAFTLTTDDGAKHSYQAGVQDMDVDHAHHPYAEANGVEINE